MKQAWSKRAGKINDTKPIGVINKVPAAISSKDRGQVICNDLELN